jgi:maltose alpha-D-glucosyltransferase/alpha-amylase
MTLDDATIASRLAASLPRTRWFADKGADVTAVTLHERVPLPRDMGAEMALADVHCAGRDPSPRYAVMIDAAGDDAALTPAVARWLLDLVLSGGSLPGRHGTFVGHPTSHAERATSVAPTESVTVSAIGGDASNTSLVVRCGSIGWVIKLFRRCRAGIQPEVEIGEFFAVASPWHDTPRLCGWLEYLPADDGHDAASTAIATVHEFAPGHATGWDRLVGLLTVGDGLPGQAGDEVFAIVGALGRATARMHRAFSARPDIPAFAPEPATPAGWQASATRMSRHAEGVFALIESRLPQLEPTIARRLVAVLAARSKLVSRFDRLPSIALATSTIRVHGDYHLGQVLVAEQCDQSLVAERENKSLVPEHAGVLVIDFEGEPGRTLAERREKTAAAKDVAGMCRSFDYLLRYVAKSSGRPYAAADLERLEACYLEAYREVAAGQPWWSADLSAADALVAVFKLDKAIYELAYELTNRPDWIDVPLAAIEENGDGRDFPYPSS